MLRHPDYTRSRINQLVQRLGDKIYSDRVPVENLTATGPGDRISFAAAQQLTGFRPVKLGEQFGPLWATYWFRGEVNVPAAWGGGRVDLLWDSQSEATLWLNGRSAQGLNMTQGDRPDAGRRRRWAPRVPIGDGLEGLADPQHAGILPGAPHDLDRKSTRLNSSHRT